MKNNEKYNDFNENYKKKCVFSFGEIIDLDFVGMKKNVLRETENFAI